MPLRLPSRITGLRRLASQIAPQVVILVILAVLLTMATFQIVLGAAFAHATHQDWKHDFDLLGLPLQATYALTEEHPSCRDMIDAFGTHPPLRNVSLDGVVRSKLAACYSELREPDLELDAYVTMVRDQEQEADDALFEARRVVVSLQSLDALLWLRAAGVALSQDPLHPNVAASLKDVAIMISPALVYFYEGDGVKVDMFRHLALIAPHAARPSTSCMQSIIKAQQSQSEGRYHQRPYFSEFNCR